MRVVIHTVIMMLILPVLSGCNVGDLTKIMTFDFKKQEQELQPTPVVDKTVKDIELAKIILKPKNLKMMVKRDPFEPLLLKTEKKLDAVEDNKLDEEVIKDIQFLGLVNMGDQPFALMSLEDVSKVYKVGDAIKKLIIAEIHADYVVLQRENRMIKLNRGDR